MTCSCYAILEPAPKILRPAIPKTINPIHAKRLRSATSLKNTIPTMAIPTAPMPVHTA